MSIQNRFNPDYAVHPGAILEETLEARGLTKKDTASRCGISAKHLNQILHGKAPVMPELAISLERVLGVAADLWTNLQCQYELHQARVGACRETDGASAWARRFPLATMVQRGWIPKPMERADEVGALLRFFGVAHRDAWETWFKGMQIAYRKSSSFQNEPESVAAWLRQGEIMAQAVGCQPFEAARFKMALDEIRKLTLKAPGEFERAMKRLCSDAGVVLVLLAELPKTRLSGATRWLTKDKALIMLSLRHKTNDHFWFSFFHEAGHILLHGKKMLFLDDVKQAESDLEGEADQFASSMLIAEKDYRAFIAGNRSPTGVDITAFADRIGIAPGVIVGRLQHDKVIGFAAMNELKEHYELSETP
jgi:HTH-type transcriptional regulator/antitoxin HigA